MGAAVKIRPLSSGRVDALLRLLSVYERESRACARVKAYYAACAMLGATLEAQLLVMCSLYPKDVEKTFLSMAPESRPKGRMDRWSFEQLLVIGRRAKWLPSRSHPRRPRLVGDLGDLIRELRNLVHPGKHARDYPKVRVRRAHFGDAQAIFDVANSWLLDHIHKSLRQAGGGRSSTSRPPHNHSKIVTPRLLGS